MDQLLAVYEAMGRWVPSPEGPYKPEDRYRDFMAVFNGNSNQEQGRRVLSQIMRECDGLMVGPAQADNHGFLAFVQGMRFVGMKISKCLVPPQPEGK